MSEHLSKRIVELYHKNALEPGEWLAIDDHLASCEDCRIRLRDTVSARETLLALQASMYSKTNAEESDLWKRFLEFSGLAIFGCWRAQNWSRYKLKLRFAMTALAVLVLSAAAVWWMLFKKSNQNVGENGPSPSAITHPSINPLPVQPLEPSSQILVALSDGGTRVTLDVQGNLVGMESLPPSDQQRIKAALANQKIDTPKMLKELIKVSGVAMGGSSDELFKLISPIGKIIADERPTFRWQPLDGALSYRVTITDPNSNYKMVIPPSPELSNTEWKADPPLKRGRIYTWQVTARTKGGDVNAPSRDEPEARFGVLEEEKAIELARAKRDYPRKHLALGVLYAQAGLLDDAVREFEALIIANPESMVAKNLLRDVSIKRRLNIHLRRR